jgi:cellulose synthase/poly-beta-1,6-N-acetylglucosamine synthase-like glycosyltransferase
MDMAYNIPGSMVLIFFILFIDFAWLYGLYNIGVVLFAIYFNRVHGQSFTSVALSHTRTQPPVAVLYTTYNDFIEKSALSCVQQDYPDFTVYILDDSTSDEYKERVNKFAAQYSDRVVVVRRPDHKAFKAGNMNHGLSTVATEEPYFAIADADEILPSDFLTKLVPVMESDPACGFVQANHRANPEAPSKLARSLGIGIDIHWKWYQPLRNRYGFVMFLGHGALLRRKCWEDINGFPDIVSEDLGFAIHAREKGYRGKFVSDVTCFEDFPDTVRAFRIRHMKWTRGTCEFLGKKFMYLVKSKNISLVEKLDILFPTMNLPLTLLYLLFMINANIFLPYYFGHQTDVTFALGGQDVVLPIITLDEGFSVIYSVDFFLITMMTFFAPVLCFILELANRPRTLFKFLCQSTALYAALSPLSSVGVLSYLATGKAIFLVTGDKQESASGAPVNGASTEDSVQKVGLWARTKANYRDLLVKSHPDQRFVQGIEILTGIGFAIASIIMMQISFLGLCFAFILLPILHHTGWTKKYVKPLIYVPFLLILVGVFTAGLSLVGMQAVFFGYGFHF